MSQKLYFDAHGHLAHRPEDLDRIVENSPVEGAFLLDISFYQSKRVVQPATPEEILEVSRRYPHFFLPFGFLDFSQPPEIVDRLKEKGFFGLKCIRPRYPYDDERYFPYYERAEKLGMPILFHTGLISQADRTMLPQGVSTNGSRMRPCYLWGIASAFPNLTMIAAHLGNPWGQEAYLCGRYENIFLDLSGGDIAYRLDWLNRYLDRGVARKLLLAVDATYGRQCYHQDILRVLNFWNDYFDFALCSRESYRYKEEIFRENARQIIAGKK
ncbi:MAG: amidohydrolase family protein [Candidatus Omnitrophica bacterium]|nr:amidohydrolase family protein [Candidatus Omnitrophota bacterium]